MTKQAPAFQFYPNDFTGSGKVGTMTTEEVGMYMLLLCLDWNENGFVFDERRLARWCRLTVSRFRRDWQAVAPCFIERDGRMYNPRLELERQKQAEWREKSRKGGQASGQARAKGGSRVVEPEGQPNGNTPSPSLSPITEEASADVSLVLEYYAKRHPRRRVSEKDRRLVQKALARYTALELRQAIDGNADDAWHREKHKHELSYVLRDTKVDGFIALGAGAPGDRRIVDEFGCFTEYGERVTRPALKVVGS